MLTQPASAGLESGCSQGTFTKRITWNERINSWVLQEFFCTRDNEWIESGWVLHNFNTTEKPDGWIPTHQFRSDGFPLIREVGSSPQAFSEEGYWDPTLTTIINRVVSQLVYAGDICSELRRRQNQWGGIAHELRGYEINPKHVYRVGNDWVWIRYQYQRDAYEAANSFAVNTRMSRIWGYRTQFPPGGGRGVVVTNVASCATEPEILG